MATVNLLKRVKFGNSYGAIVDITMSDSYPTDGESIDAQAFGLEVLDFVNPASTNGYVFSFDHTNKKLMAYYSDYDGIADGALIQVPNATNLSAVTVRAMAFGL